MTILKYSCKSCHNPKRQLIKIAPSANLHPPNLHTDGFISDMGRNVITCVASLGCFALGTVFGRRRRRSPVPPPAPPVPSPTPPPCRSRLDCPVCLEELVLPRVTPCGHTICSRCLLALFEHERRPACPVCRKRIRVVVDKLPVNFLVKAVVEASVAERGEGAWRDYSRVEEEAKRIVQQDEDGDVVQRLRPAWNWVKWSVLALTEVAAFVVSLKEVLEAAPARRRYQRIV